LDNGYPLDFIFDKINLRLKKLFVQRTNIAFDPINANSNAERKIIVLPYVQPLSEFISSNIDKSKANIGFCCLNKLSRFKNNVIYKIACNNCDVTYVGQTKRQLRTRIKEHKNNIKLNQPKHSVISEHIIKFNHSFDWDNAKILDCEFKFYKKIISEMIHIKEQEASLNLNSDTELFNESYFDILKELTDY